MARTTVPTGTVDATEATWRCGVTFDAAAFVVSHPGALVESPSGPVVDLGSLVGPSAEPLSPVSVVEVGSL